MLSLSPIPGIPDDCLAPGLHWAGIREFRDAFVTNYHRSWLFEGLVKASIALRQAGCSRIFIGGSFVTTKEFPGDYDACWDPAGVSANLLDPILFEPARLSEQQKAYRGEWFIGKNGNGPESAMYQFLSRDKESGIERGMIGIKLKAIELYNL